MDVDVLADSLALVEALCDALVHVDSLALVEALIDALVLADSPRTRWKRFAMHLYLLTHWRLLTHSSTREVLADSDALVEALMDADVLADSDALVEALIDADVLADSLALVEALMDALVLADSLALVDALCDAGRTCRLTRTC